MSKWDWESKMIALEVEVSGGLRDALRHVEAFVPYSDLVSIINDVTDSLLVKIQAYDPTDKLN